MAKHPNHGRRIGLELCADWMEFARRFNDAGTNSRPLAAFFFNSPLKASKPAAVTFGETRSEHPGNLGDECMLRLISGSSALAALALVALFPLSASAHGPTRQKVTETVEINAPADKVWAVLGKFQDMSWHPAIGKSEGSGDNAPGAKRTLTLKSGGTIAEELIKFNGDDKSFAYEIKDVDVKVLPVTNYSSSMAVKGEGGKTTVEWKGAFYRGYVNNDPPAELSDEAAIAAVKGVYRAGLDALKAKLEAGG
jgi:hypothetical protein